MTDDEVPAKKEAAIRWCQQASEHALNHDGRPGTCVLIAHDSFAENMTLDGMARQYSVKRWQLKRSNRNSRTEEGKWGAPVTTPRPFNLTNVGRGTDASTAPPDAPPEEKLIGRLSAAC